MVEIFKTDLQTKEQSQEVLKILLNKFPKFQINFDLEDCDKILRVQGKQIEPNEITNLLNKNGYKCELLE